MIGEVEQIITPVDWIRVMDNLWDLYCDVYYA